MKETIWRNNKKEGETIRGRRNWRRKIKKQKALHLTIRCLLGLSSLFCCSVLLLLVLVLCLFILFSWSPFPFWLPPERQSFLFPPPLEEIIWGHVTVFCLLLLLVFFSPFFGFVRYDHLFSWFLFLFVSLPAFRALFSSVSHLLFWLLLFL